MIYRMSFDYGVIPHIITSVAEKIMDHNYWPLKLEPLLPRM